MLYKGFDIHMIFDADHGYWVGRITDIHDILFAPDDIKIDKDNAGMREIACCNTVLRTEAENFVKKYIDQHMIYYHLDNFQTKEIHYNHFQI